MHISRFTASSLALATAIVAACGVHTNQNGAVKITAVNPGTGSITGGIAVTIEGLGLDDGTSTATVLFGASPAIVTSVAANAIQVTLPSGSTCQQIDVQVTNALGSAIKQSAFKYSGGTGTVHVTSVSPAQGTISGGTPLTITGSGFTGGVGVMLGGVSLQNIQVVSDTQITAMTPSTVTGGAADLSVHNCSSQSSLPAAFIFTTGLHGGIVDFNLTTKVNPAQYASPTPTPAYSDPFVVFIQPSTISLLNTLPPAGTCVFNAPSSGPPAVTLQDAGTTVQLSSGAAAMTLSKQPNGTYFFPYFTDTLGNQSYTAEHYGASSSYLNDAFYDIDATGGQIPAFTVTQAFKTPTDYTVTAPPNFGAATPQNVTRATALAFAWTGGTPATVFEILLVGLDAAGKSTNERLFCIAAADGASGNYTIAAGDIGKFTPATKQIDAYTNRRLDTDFVIPVNGSTATAIASNYKEAGMFLVP